MLAVKVGVAEFERDLVRARSGEGRARAVANGVELGRKRTLTHQKRKAIASSVLARPYRRDLRRRLSGWSPTFRLYVGAAALGKAAVRPFARIVATADCATAPYVDPARPDIVRDLARRSAF